MKLRQIISTVLVTGLLGATTIVPSHAERSYPLSAFATSAVDYFTLLGSNNQNTIRNTRNNNVIGPYQDLHIVAMTKNKSGVYGKYNDNGTERYINLETGITLPEGIKLRVPNIQPYFVQNMKSMDSFTLLDQNGKEIIKTPIVDYMYSYDFNYIIAESADDNNWYLYQLNTGKRLLEQPILYEPVFDYNKDMFRVQTLDNVYHYFNKSAIEQYSNTDDFEPSKTAVSSNSGYKDSLPPINAEDAKRLKKAKPIPNTDNLVYVKEKDGYHIFNTKYNQWFPDTYHWIDIQRTKQEMDYGLLVKVNGICRVISSYDGILEIQLPDDIYHVITYNRHTAILEQNNSYAAYTDDAYVINYQPKQILLNETYQTNNELIDKEH